MTWQILAIKGLKDESMKVYAALTGGREEPEGEAEEGLSLRTEAEGEDAEGLSLSPESDKEEALLKAGTEKTSVGQDSKGEEVRASVSQDSKGDEGDKGKDEEDTQLVQARYAVSMIVGRDTANLSREGVIKAAVETVAENASDGVIAPMLFLALGGPILGFFYKSVNTMDSMIGYKNDRYLYFGRFAAKLDDVLNYLPARISALFMICASFFSDESLSGKRAYRIWKRDRRKHASPNSAQTEAVAAGALGLGLAGDAYYFGKLVPKQVIGDATRPPEDQDIVRANKLLYGTAILTEGVCLAVMSVVNLLITMPF
ncbi:MAG: adenosylcobinamide-phosphate synthase CbiB [Lachnospiraceae bacterium]|nr:adenosylcobinamide-phosphate synthase CbiB [Lachnospiraceae bacterium]